MPLLDHFHPPLGERRHWEGFHTLWAGALTSIVTRVLPPGYFAEPHIHVGTRIEVDVATFEDDQPAPEMGMPGAGGGTATLTQAAPAAAYAPPAPTMVLPALFPDSLEVLVYSGAAGPVLVAAIELVSPGNKDRNDRRTAFAAKCAAYLQRGVGLILMDVVTSRRVNLHNRLADLLGWDEKYRLAAETLYAVAYRPRRHITNGQPPVDHIEAWPTNLPLGQPLPVLPLALDKGQVIPVDFEPAYVEACERTRLS